MVVTTIDECAEWNDEKMSWLYEWLRRKTMSENEVIPVKINVLHHDHDERRQFRYGTWGLNEGHPTHYIVSKEKWERVGDETKRVSLFAEERLLNRLSRIVGYMADNFDPLDKRREDVCLIARGMLTGGGLDDDDE